MVPAGELGQVLGGGAALPVHTQLCKAEQARLREAAAGGVPLMVACGQEAASLREALPEELAEDTRFVDIRDRGRER